MDIKYVVYRHGQHTSTHRVEERAINRAIKEGGRREGCIVEMHINDGTYHSTTQVWPETGPTYSN